LAALSAILIEFDEKTLKCQAKVVQIAKSWYTGRSCHVVIKLSRLKSPGKWAGVVQHYQADQ